MKKILLSLVVAAAALFATSCANELDENIKGNGNGVTFEISTPELASRADFGTGVEATKLLYAVYDETAGKSDLDKYIVSALSRLTVNDALTIPAGGSTSFALDLLDGNRYSVLFWAVSADYANAFEIKWAEKAMQMKTGIAGNDESFDAFFGYIEPFTVEGAITKGSILTRPFAQLNIGTSDLDFTNAANANFNTNNISSKVVIEVPTVLDCTNGNVGTPATITYGSTRMAAGYTFPVNGYNYLAMNYVLVGEKQVYNATLTVTDGDINDAKTKIIENTYNNIPLARNYKTNVYGALLTNGSQFEVTIDKTWDTPAEEVDVWDGTTITAPTTENLTIDNNEVTEATISNGAELAWLAALINGTLTNAPSNVATRAEATPALAANATITLGGDIDLGGMEWTAIGTEAKNFTGTFDGAGFSISNLKMTVTEGKEGKAYMGLFGYAKNATIKNLTVVNVDINIACLDIDHSQGHIGAIAGSLEGTSTIENVTVKGDVKVYATQNANGASRVAVIAGGNSYGDVTMKNVHVVANEGSYLIANNNTGALAGQLQGKSVFEDCSSNINVTVNKFFAGGLIGLAAGDQTFINCKSTGNVAVVAGREGRAHDQYRVGGIAGGWADGANKVCTLTYCSYTGEVSGTNSDGSVAEPLDYAGYVGRGYTLNGCQGSKVVINGDEYVQAFNNAAYAGVYYVNGELIINSAAELKAFAAAVNGGNYFAGKTVKLGADIDLNNEEWTPIGSAYKDHGFMGNFDGNGKTIKNLKMTTLPVDADNYVYAGLFGVTEGTDKDNQNYIKNLTIENVTIATEGHIAAAAVAYPYYTALENITVKGNISIKGGDYTAGVLAYTRRCVDAKDIVINGNEGSVIEGNNTIGGVISDIQMNGGLTANYSNFKATGLTIKGVKCVGGISGIISLQTLNGATVKNVTLDCNDNRVGIVAGAYGGKSTLENVSYENVTGATRVIGATYDKGYYVGQIVEVEGVEGVIYTIENGVKAVSVAEQNLQGKTWQNAMDWAAGLGEGWALASMEDLNTIYDLRVELNKALKADNAENALFWEGDEYYSKNGTVYYVLYMSSDEVPVGESDANGNSYLANRVFFKRFNKLGYWDVLYSSFDSINKNAPLRDNYFARGVIEVK